MNSGLLSVCTLFGVWFDHFRGSLVPELVLPT